MHASSIKHITTLFSLSDHDILSREWRVSVGHVQTNYHDRPMVPGVNELLIMTDPHYDRMCLSQLKPSELYSVFSTAENVELLGLYPIRNLIYRPVKQRSVSARRSSCFTVYIPYHNPKYCISHHSCFTYRLSLHSLPTQIILLQWFPTVHIGK